MKRLGICAMAALMIAAPAMAAEKLIVETNDKCSFTIALRPDYGFRNLRGRRRGSAGQRVTHGRP